MNFSVPFICRSKAQSLRHEVKHGEDLAQEGSTEHPYVARESQSADADDNEINSAQEAGREKRKTGNVRPLSVVHTGTLHFAVTVVSFLRSLGTLERDLEGAGHQAECECDVGQLVDACAEGVHGHDGVEAGDCICGCVCGGLREHEC